MFEELAEDALSDCDLESVAGGGKAKIVVKAAYAAATLVVEEALEWVSGFF
jgi:hypothetical protein